MSSTLSAWGIRVKAQSDKVAGGGGGSGVVQAMMMGPSSSASSSASASASASSSSSTPAGKNRTSAAAAMSMLDKEEDIDDDRPLSSSSRQTTAMKASSAAAAAMMTGLLGFSSPYSSTNTRKKDDTTVPPSPDKECDMYLQSNLGACFCVSAGENGETTGTSQTQQVATTSSLLLIRKSTTVPCPSTKGWTFQWYYSSTKNTASRNVIPTTTTSTTNGGTSPTPGKEFSACELEPGCHVNKNERTDDDVVEVDDVVEEDDDATDTNDNDEGTTWMILPGATHAAFQPNTTLIGRRLRCIVKIPTKDDTKEIRSSSSLIDDSDDSASHDDDGDDDDDNNHDTAGSQKANGALDAKHNNGTAANEDNDQDNSTRSIVCTLKDPISADMTMFNGACQALSRGAKFGTLIGRPSSPAAGETFRVEITKIDTPFVLRSNKKPVCVNSVRLYRKVDVDDDNSCGGSNGGYIPVLDQAVLNVSARADPAHGRNFDLVFRTLPSPESDMEEKLLKFCTSAADADADGTRHLPRLELETSNRMTRESLLLTLGIANFWGDSSRLNNRTVLYRDESRSTTKSPSNPVSGNVHNQNEDGTSPSISAEGIHKTDSERDENNVSAVDAVESSTRQSAPENRINPVSVEKVQLMTENVDPDPVVTVNTPNSDVTQSPSSIDPNLVKKMEQMEKELSMLRSKLIQKDNDMANLLHDYQKSEDDHHKTKQQLESYERDLRQSQQDCESIQQSKRQVERALQSTKETIKKVEANHKVQLQKVENEKVQQGEKISDLEKTLRTLQNEKAVLGAAVEARESKLSQLDELKISNDELAQQIAQQDELHKRLEDSNQRYNELQNELDSKSAIELQCRKELEDALVRAEQLQISAKKEQEKASSCYSQFEGLQKKNQQLKGERNSFKQKNDSLSKEISRICKDGRTIRDVEKILADHDSLVHEAGILRVQKRRALEDAHTYRQLYDQVKAAEQLHGTEEETRRTLQRTAELERLLSEMTDYVQAKEMQLETMKQVNEALQEEIKNLAKASFHKNDI